MPKHRVDATRGRQVLRGRPGIAAADVSASYWARWRGSVDGSMRPPIVREKELVTGFNPSWAVRLATLAALTLAQVSPLGLRAAAAQASAERAARTALALTAHPARGAALFGRLCSRCHGAAGQGDPALAIPELAGQRVAYLVRQFANFHAGRRESTRMHRVVSQTALRNPQDWADIAAYLGAANPPPTTQTGTGANVALGRGIFHEQCASCHGPQARGEDKGFVPSLRNQHYSYLVKQMRRLAAGDRHSMDENLERFLRSFDARDVDAVADYLSRLRGR